ncbi:MAG: MmoB/DmpM family protein [Actinobacteria bacterium]|nr:MmoB/DmpM family protein [Actinomycetota bacterium]
MSEDQYKFDRTSSDRAGVTMSASIEGNAIGDLMSEKEGVEVTKYPAMLRIDGGKILEFDMNEIAEYLGEEEFTTYDFEIETSTHYGRMVRLDDPPKVIVFANPEDAAEYLGFDLPEEEEGPTLPA